MTPISWILAIALPVLMAIVYRKGGETGGDKWRWGVAPVLLLAWGYLMLLPWWTPIGLAVGFLAFRLPAMRWLPVKTGYGVSYLDATKSDLTKGVLRHGFALAFIPAFWPAPWLAIPTFAAFVAVSVLLAVENKRALPHDINSAVERLRGGFLGALISATAVVYLLSTHHQ